MYLSASVTHRLITIPRLVTDIVTQRKKTLQDVTELENREIYDQISTARYVTSKRGCREHSVNAVLRLEKFSHVLRYPSRPVLVISRCVTEVLGYSTVISTFHHDLLRSDTAICVLTKA